jgi:transposase
VREYRPPGSVRGARGNACPLYVAACSGDDDISPSSKESGEPHASLRSTNLCGRYGPASPSSAVHAERYPGTRHAADPAYKVARRGALPCSSTILVARMVAGMSDAIVGIDVSKETLDANFARGQRKQGRIFANTPDGWKLMLSWLKAIGSKQAHICMEATGRHSLGVALALHDAGHVVSVVNPAQIRDFARTKLGRNKTDKVDAALIREYADLLKPEPWAPPSPAMRRLCELQTVRAGIVSNRAEWKNRIASGLGDNTATTLAAATIEHFTSQLEAIDTAIGETIDQDAELCGRRDLLLSVIGVGETLAASLLTEMPEPGVLRRSGEMVAYAGLNPSHHRSGSSIDRPTRISKIGNATLRSSLYMPALSAMRFNPAVAALVARLKSAGRLKPKQIVVAAMRKLLVLCFGVLKTGKRFDPAIAMPA